MEGTNWWTRWKDQWCQFVYTKMRSSILLPLTACVAAVSAGLIGRQVATPSPGLSNCPGYNATNVVQTANGLTADLTLAGQACNVYGNDIRQLKLSVNYDTASRLHVKIEDAATIAYQVSEQVLSRPSTANSVAAGQADLQFGYQTSPFTFNVTRRSNGQVLFDSSAASLIFEDQYIRLRTALPANPNIYGLGEHSDSLRLNTTNYTRTLWNRDAYGIPSGTNLYGHHPVYFDHRGENGTHGVFLRSSVGMDVKINNTQTSGQYLEYNLLGGVVDLYFLSGATPVQVSQQYSQTVGQPAMPPYWAFGFHQCRYGYRDFYAIAEVVYNYSIAGIPLETMWTDIDYMYERYIMTTDPNRFPVARVRDYVNYLHARNQHYIVMVDPAIAYQTQRENNQTYGTFTRFRDQGLLLQKNESIYQGVVWPGQTAFPDWFHPNTTQAWIDEFAVFFNSESGVDIDGLWIDMNEAANFNYFGNNAEQSAKERGFPPTRPSLRSGPRALPGFPAAFQPNSSSPYPPDSLSYAPPWLSPDASPNTKRSTAAAKQVFARQATQNPSASNGTVGYANRNLLAPPYQIKNVNSISAYGGLSNFTLDTDIIHYDGHTELDVHNLYGSMMNRNSRAAMLSRRPGRRPLVVTRSTFAGDGRNVAKWLGDNLSTWEQYRQSIQGMLDFAAFFQVPMVGSDVCGFGANTTETLCARWAMLGAFNPFYRNHNGDSSLPQEFYLWNTVTQAAKNAIDIRYRLLDYIYTALHKQSTDGTPMLSPLFFTYPNDVATFGLDLQFFYGNSLLISPVTEENSTSVDIYLPNDLFYDFYTYRPIQGNGSTITLNNFSFTEIPIHIKAGSIIPMRNNSANTTTDLRKQPFHVLIAPNNQGSANGTLYLDDGDSLVQGATSRIEMRFTGNVLNVMGDFSYRAENASVAKVTLLGVTNPPSRAPEVKAYNVTSSTWAYNATSQSVEINANIPLTGAFSVVF